MTKKNIEELMIAIRIFAPAAKAFHLHYADNVSYGTECKFVEKDKLCEVLTITPNIFHIKAWLDEDRSVDFSRASDEWFLCRSKHIEASGADFDNWYEELLNSCFTPTEFKQDLSQMEDCSGSIWLLASITGKPFRNKLWINPHGLVKSRRGDVFPLPKETARSLAEFFCRIHQ